MEIFRPFRYKVANGIHFIIHRQVQYAIITSQCPLNIINLHWKDEAVHKLDTIKKVGGILCSLLITFYKFNKVYCIRLKHVGFVQERRDIQQQMLGVRTEEGFRCHKPYPGLMQISRHTSTSTSTWEHVFLHPSTWRDVGSSVPAAASSSSAVTDRTKCQPRGKQTTGEEVMWRKGKRKTEEVEGTGGLGTMRFERDFYEGTYKHNAICFAL